MNYMGLMFIGSQRFIDFKMWVPRKKVWETLVYIVILFSNHITMILIMAYRLDSPSHNEQATL